MNIATQEKKLRNRRVEYRIELAQPLTQLMIILGLKPIQRAIIALYKDNCEYCVIPAALSSYTVTRLHPLSPESVRDFITFNIFDEN
jgi:hypothetical protein